SEEMVVLRGSEKEGVSPHAAPPADPNERVEVTVRLRAKNPVIDSSRRLTHDEYAAAHGADDADLDKICDYAALHGLYVSGTDRPRRTMPLMGPVGDLEAAFGAFLGRRATPQGSFRERQGPVMIPKSLEGIIEGVFGLDDRPQAQPKFQLLPTIKAHAGGT